MIDSSLLQRILERARWAPSGDNTQPWRFELVDAAHVAVHGFDTRDHVLYDFDGRASQLAHGALLETIRLAASCHGMHVEWCLRPDCPETAPIYDVRLVPDATIECDPLQAFIETRVVQRRPMRFSALTPGQREALSRAIGPGYRLRFFETFADRLRVARLLWANAHIRLTTPEAFEVHRSIIEWGVQFSEDRIPDRAVGVDPLTSRLMRWVMHSWQRVDFFNRYLLGTVVPRIQLDFLPALASSAHVLIRPVRKPDGLSDYLEAGVALQRLWLAAEEQGLHLQPEMTPVIFRWYAQAGRSFSARQGVDAATLALVRNFEAIVPAAADDPFVFFARVGFSGLPSSRSVRKSLADLMWADECRDG